MSAFRLDKYEVTIGRFRKFVDAVVGGWQPAQGAGKHVHLNGGEGLKTATGYEPGWDPGWSAAYLPTSKATWDSYLACYFNPPWTPSAGANETKPINCVNRYQAYAFCIWDGGFLPSEAEWNYVATNGADQTAYPWGSEAPAANTILAIYDCYFNGTGGSGTCTGESIAPVGSAPGGNGKKWGHVDLSGNVREWTADFAPSSALSNYLLPCNDCVSPIYPPGVNPVNGIARGGSYLGPAEGVRAGRRDYGEAGARFSTIGARCARQP